MRRAGVVDVGGGPNRGIPCRGLTYKLYELRGLYRIASLRQFHDSEESPTLLHPCTLDCKEVDILIASLQYRHLSLNAEDLENQDTQSSPPEHLIGPCSSNSPLRALLLCASLESFCLSASVQSHSLHAR